MDDLLYTLLVIGWIAYGIYKGVKKNKSKATKIALEIDPDLNPSSDKKASPLSAIFSEVFDLAHDEHDEISHPYQPVEAPKTPEKPVYSENHLKVNRLDSYSGSDAISSIFEDENQPDNSFYESDEISEYQHEADTDIHEESVVDLRQAIIHQVILERPY